MGGFLVSPKWFLFGCQWSPTSMWTFWLAPTGTPPLILCSLFGWTWTNQKTPNAKPTRSWRPSFLCWSFLTLQAPLLPFQWELDQQAHPWTSKCPPKQKSPSKSSKKSLREIGCQWSTLYILYVQIYKHKDVVSLRISSSPRISVKILHQRLLPFVAAISSVFTRPFRLPVANHQRRWKAPRSWRIWINCKMWGACEEHQGINEFISDYIVYIVMYIYIYHIMITGMYYIVYLLYLFARKVRWFL